MMHLVQPHPQALKARWAMTLMRATSMLLPGLSMIILKVKTPDKELYSYLANYYNYKDQEGLQIDKLSVYVGPGYSNEQPILSL